MTASKEGPVTNSDPEFHRPEWLKFSVEDKRLAVVTVAATLVANIITLIIVGFALAANDAFNELGKLNQRKWNLPWWAGFAMLGVLIFAAIIFSLKRVRQSAFTVALEIAGGLLGILWALFMIFALLGKLAALN